MKIRLFLNLTLFSFYLFSCSASESYDVLIRHARIIDGSGNSSYLGDVGIKSDTIASIGDLRKAIGKEEINAKGMVVSPGFINMLSWAVESLIEDGKSEGDIRQGVTLEVFGEGESWGPLTEASKKALIAAQGDIKYELTWESLAEYLDFLEKKGISTNVASFIGATTLRINKITEPTSKSNSQSKKKSILWDILS